MYIVKNLYHKIESHTEIGVVFMDIGDLISDSLKYPSSNMTWVLVLGILFLVSILIIPLFLNFTISL